ncbi:BamA/TamA family outer membrane protein [Flavobacterium foetidum]|uniref:hypothetical protein n=1 Tax=Flavobacterium foetidum TaxID=2026681 RepID=UPI0010758359|nr:hypothetical protein [Flavobacterium foetidum]KAF2513478.1 hypothetical protein E0W73_14610 [Flavobacterium foetidum]
MKQPAFNTFLFFFFLGFSFCCCAQNFHLKITGGNQNEDQVIDSLGYSKKHPNLKSLFNEVENTSEKLSKKGYLDHQVLKTAKTNDSTYTSVIELKKKVKEIHIYIGKSKDILGFYTEKDTVKILYTELESFFSEKITVAEKAGYALSRIKLENIQRKGLIVLADLNFKLEKKRTINAIVVNYTNESKGFFPEGHLKQLNKKYLNKTFNQNTIKELHNDINSFEFVAQTKYPEILFTNDSTKIYTYIEKRKANNFDGYIGFSNDDEKKLNLNGYLDISLLNILKSGEQFSLYWKSDGNQQKTFNAKIEIPYIFKSPLGIKAQLNIFKQDSTFQNTKTAIDLGYYLNYNSKIYLGYQSTESSDILNQNNSTISDFDNAYITSSFDFKKRDYSNILFPIKSFFNLMTGYGKRNSAYAESPSSVRQFYANLNFGYNFELNKKNFININSQNYILSSQSYLVNELIRFGGINSIRGFLENSLQANFSALLLTEYRYLLSPNIYINSIVDYGIYQDLTTSTNPKKIKNLTSFGIGATLNTINGILRINLTNGVENGQDLQLYNSIINICYNVKF